MLRYLGILFGFVIVFQALMRCRGARWNRNELLISLFVGFGIALVSFNPNVLNHLISVFQLHDMERARLEIITIFSIFVLFVLLLHARSKLFNLKMRVQQLFETLPTVLSEIASDNYLVKPSIQPIMVVLPAYNEQDAIRDVLLSIPKQVHGYPVGVLVVDDGSQDRTKAVARDCGVGVFSSLINSGQGAASRIAYEYLKRFPEVKVVVTMDADGQHDPDQIGQLVQPILAGKADIVIGSRKLGRAEKVSWIRDFGLFFLTKLINVISNARLTDCSSGYKAIRTSVLNAILLQEEQFQAAEFIIESIKRGYRILEVPIDIRQRSAGESKKGTDLRYGYGFSKVILRTWWRR